MIFDREKLKIPVFYTEKKFSYVLNRRKVFNIDK